AAPLVFTQNSWVNPNIMASHNSTVLNCSSTATLAWMTPNLTINAGVVPTRDGITPCQSAAARGLIRIRQPAATTKGVSPVAARPQLLSRRDPHCSQVSSIGLLGAEGPATRV